MGPAKGDCIPDCAAGSGWTLTGADLNSRACTVSSCSLRPMRTWKTLMCFACSGRTILGTGMWTTQSDGQPCDGDLGSSLIRMMPSGGQKRPKLRTPKTHSFCTTGLIILFLSLLTLGDAHRKNLFFGYLIKHFTRTIWFAQKITHHCLSKTTGL